MAVWFGSSSARRAATIRERPQAGAAGEISVMAPLAKFRVRSSEWEIGEWGFALLG